MASKPKQTHIRIHSMTSSFQPRSAPLSSHHSLSTSCPLPLLLTQKIRSTQDQLHTHTFPHASIPIPRCRRLNTVTYAPEVLQCASAGALWPRPSVWGSQVERYMWQAACAGSNHAAYTLGMVSMWDSSLARKQFR